MLEKKDHSGKSDFHDKKLRLGKRHFLYLILFKKKKKKPSANTQVNSP